MAPYDAPDQPPVPTQEEFEAALQVADAHADEVAAGAEQRANEYTDLLRRDFEAHSHDAAPDPEPDPTEPAASSVVPVSKFAGDVRKAVAEAQQSGGPKSVVKLDMKRLPVLGECVVSDSISIRGEGPGSTVFVHDGAYRGPVFTIYQAKRNGQLESTVNGGPILTYDPDTDKGQVTFDGFSIVARKREAGVIREGMHLMSLDDARMGRVDFHNLTGTALKLGADEDDETKTSPGSGRVRESNFNELGIYTCGSGAPDAKPGDPNDIPALIIQGSSAEGDGTNQIFFNQLRFVYNFGRAVINGRDDGDTLRRIMFRDTQIHGLADNKNWTPVKYFPFDMFTLEGAVREIFFDGVFINGGKAGTAGWVMKGSPVTAQTPKRLVLRDVNVVNMAGDLIRVEAGDSVYVDGTSLSAVGGRIVNNVAGSGLARYGIHELGVNSPAGEAVSGVSGGVSWMGQPV